MRVAVIADIHGNAPALEAVLRDIDALGIETIVDCGDACSGPLPAETLDLLAGLGDRLHTVLGNADRELLVAVDDPDAELTGMPPGIVAATRFAADQLGATRHAALAARAGSLVLDVDGLGSTCFCHGTPRSADEIVTAASTDTRLAGILADVPQAVVVGGHTHMQLDRTSGRHRIVNPGSVGLPYDGAPGAYWAILGPDVELRCTPYDLGEALARIRASSMPDVDASFAALLETPPRPADVVPQFEARATAG